MKRLFFVLLLASKASLAQVFGPDPSFCFNPIYKVFDSKVIADDNYFIPQNDGGYIFTSNFNIINGIKVENQPLDNNVKTYFKFDKEGKLLPMFKFLAPNRYVYDGKVLPDGKMLWNESNIGVNNVRIIRTNEDGTIDATYQYENYDNYIYKKFLLKSGKVIVSTGQENHKVVDENGKILQPKYENFPAKSLPINNTYNSTDDIILLRGFDNTALVFKINADLSLKQIYSKVYGSSAWLSYSKIYLDSKGRIYLLLFENNDAGFCTIIRLNNDGSEDTSFTTITTLQSPELDPQSAKLTFTESGKIVYSRQNIISCFDDHGKTDEFFKIAPVEKGRIIYDINKYGEVIVSDKNGFRKIDFNNAVLPFQLKLEKDTPILINNILSTNKEKFFVSNGNYVGRFTKDGKLEKEMFSKDTILVIKEYFDKQLIIKKNHKNYLFSADEINETTIPEVFWKGSFDYKARKVYLVEGDALIRYDEFGNQEARSPHGLQTIKQIFVLADKKLMIIAKYFGNNNTYLIRLNQDGKPDTSFSEVVLGQAGFSSLTYDLVELQNGDYYLKETNFGESTANKIKYFTSKGGVELNKANPLTLYGNIVGPKIVGNNAVLIASYYFQLNQQDLNLYNSTAIIDNSFSLKGVNMITGFEILNNNDILLASNDRVYRMVSKKNRFITLEIPLSIEAEAKPVIIKARSSDGSLVKLSISGVGTLKDSTLTWNDTGIGTISAQFENSSCYEVIKDFNITFTPPFAIDYIPNKQVTSPPFKVILTNNADINSTNFTVSGNAYMIGNTVYLTGKAGQVCITASRNIANINREFKNIACFNVEGKDIEVAPVLSNEPVVSLDHVLLFPNPVVEGFYVFVETEKLDEKDKETFELFDIWGNRIDIHTKKTSEKAFYIQSKQKLNKGTYLLKFILNKQTYIKRIAFE